MLRQAALLEARTLAFRFRPREPLELRRLRRHDLRQQAEVAAAAVVHRIGRGSELTQNTYFVLSPLAARPVSVSAIFWMTIGAFPFDAITPFHGAG